jgi:hypothetical protein
MRIHVPCTALGLTLAAAAPAAHAQTVLDTAQPVVALQPVVVAPAATAVVTPPPQLRTVRIVTTTTTTRAVQRRPLARRQVTVTRHAYVAGRVAPATTTTTTTVATASTPAPYVSGPLYDVAAPPATVEPYGTEPLYDTGPAIIPAATAPAVAPVGSAVPAYRYVYQPDRILVIDPNTGIAVQAIPR